MNFAVRDGKFDVVVAAGPRVDIWPTPGVRTLSSVCAEMGLTVGQFGPETLTVKGVIPLPGTGGLVLIEDIQRRIHRIQARAIIRVLPDSSLPDPFPGWRSQGVLPLQTAEKLKNESKILWEPLTVILGTGNRALKFGSSLLESGLSQVLCVETHAQWGAKRIAGWEVEQRRFEMLGGKITEAKPIQLTPKGPLLWQLRLQDSLGVRILDVGRVISAGPFRDSSGVREYPPGSLLFELDQTSANTLEEDVEGWLIEEQRGIWLAGKIVKSLINDLGPKRETLDSLYRRARGRLKRYFRHRELPFTPAYQGKWLAITELKKLKNFKGVPQKAHLSRPIASVECFEEIPCNLCQTSCPVTAITIGKVPRAKGSILNEDACTACGQCLVVCPTRSIALIQERENQSFSKITLPWKGAKPWSVGEFATLINRRGESLGSARIVGFAEPKNDKVQLLQIEIPTHLIWEARSVKRGRATGATDDTYLTQIDRSALAQEKVEITLNGEKRMVRDRIPISTALFEIGQGRSNDILLCKDGSCGLCDLSVDSVKKSACQTRIHRGMAIRIDSLDPQNQDDHTLCPCLGITYQDVIERLKQGKLRSPEAVLSVTHVGEGKCHGQLCMGAFKRVLQDQGLEMSQWIDWRFPWTDWVLTHN